MKKLLLVRHGKASQNVDYDDFERPLKTSGTEDVMLMAERLKSRSIIPQRLITSPALRTLTTANILAEHLGLHKPAEDARIYEAGQQTLLDVINEFSDNYNFIALIGHNPAISQLVGYLANQSRDMSPGTVALVTFEVDEWASIGFNSGTLTWFSSPKDSQ